MSYAKVEGRIQRSNASAGRKTTREQKRLTYSSSARFALLAGLTHREVGETSSSTSRRALSIGRGENQGQSEADTWRERGEGSATSERSENWVGEDPSRIRRRGKLRTRDLAKHTAKGSKRQQQHRVESRECDEIFSKTTAGSQA